VTDLTGGAAPPTVKAHNGVWVWLGVPELADERAIVDLSFLSKTPSTAFFCGYIPMAADYLLGVDNIMDLSHADFVHPESLGGGAITRTQARVSRTGHGIHIIWDSKNEVAFPIFDRLLPTAGMKVDSCTEVTWYPPSVMILRSRCAPAGEPFDKWIDARSLHVMTPETERKTHYFYAAARGYAQDDAALNAMQEVAIRAAFELEDKPLIEAQQLNMGTADFWSLRPVLLSVDAGAAQVRRTLEKMIRAEG
jgi:vanillate O-demethylase monooxygenase subunit